MPIPIEDVVLGGVYEGKIGTFPRTVTELGFWWSAYKYHPLVSYVGRSGRTIEANREVFARWATRRIDTPASALAKADGTKEDGVR